MSLGEEMRILRQRLADLSKLRGQVEPATEPAVSPSERPRFVEFTYIDSSGRQSKVAVNPAQVWSVWDVSGSPHHKGQALIERNGQTEDQITVNESFDDVLRKLRGDDK